MYLSLDTATDRPSFALGTPEAPGEAIVLADRRELSREIERVVRDLARARGTLPNEWAGVVVADGPGSFTGLRIGIAFAKGLCRAAGLPLLVVPSMMGAGLGGGDEVVVTYDALRGEVYRARFAYEPKQVRTVESPHVAPPVTGPARHEADASAASLLRLVPLAGAARRIEDLGAFEPVYGRLAEAEAKRKASGAVR